MIQTMKKAAAQFQAWRARKYAEYARNYEARTGRPPPPFYIQVFGGAEGTAIGVFVLAVLLFAVVASFLEGTP